MVNVFDCKKWTVLTALCLCASGVPLYAQGYSGPSLLSRGGNKPGQRGKAPVDFTFYAALRGTYQSGLLPTGTVTGGDLPKATASGLQAEVGVYGAHNWRRSTFGMDYRGDWRESSRVSRAYSGSNHALSAEYTWQPTQRIGFSAGQFAGTTNRAFGGFTAPAFSETDRPGVPLNEFFDSRVYFAQSTISASYTQSARLAFIVTGSYFAVRRTNRALVSVNGYRASGQIDYRASRSDTVALIYDTSIYKFPRAFGDSRVDVYAGQYKRRISANVDARVMGGIFRADTTGTQQVTLSPEVALILGRTTGFAAYNRVAWQPRVEGEVSYTFQRSRFFVMALQGVNAGNGIYLTTKQKVVRTGFSYTGIRKVALGVSAGYSRGSSLAQTLRDYSAKHGGGGLSYGLFPHVSLSAQADYRTFSSPGVRGREGVSLSVGLAFSPSSLPLSIW